MGIARKYWEKYGRNGTECKCPAGEKYCHKMHSGKAVTKLKKISILNNTIRKKCFGKSAAEINVVEKQVFGKLHGKNESRDFSIAKF